MDRMYNTTQLERELLHVLLNDKLTLMKVCSKVKGEWMSNQPRLFILERIKEAFQSHRSCISRETMLYEFRKAYDEQLQPAVISEMEQELDTIYSSKPIEKIGFIMDKLTEAFSADSIKDIIEKSFMSLEKGDISDALAIIKSGAVSLSNPKVDKSIKGLHADYEDWLDEIVRRKEHPEDYCGIRTGFKMFDDQTGGLFGAELTLFFGLAGKGKSTVVKNICSRIRMQGYNVLHVTNEENEFQVRTKYQALESGIEYYKFKRGFVSDEEVEAWKEFNRLQRESGAGEIYIKEIPQNTDATGIYAAWNELRQKGIKIDVIAVDYMDLMSSIAHAFSEWDNQGKVVNDLKQLAIDTNLPVITVTQAGIQVEKLETKDNPFVTAGDVYGAKAKTHTANTIIGIVNKSATVNVNERNVMEQNRQKLIFCVCKNRDGALFSYRQVLEPEFGRLVDDDEDDKAADKIAKGVLLSSADAKEDAGSRYKNNVTEMESISQNVKDKMKGRTSSLIDKVRSLKIDE